MGKIIVVANRLPLVLEKMPSGKINSYRSVGGLATAIDSLATRNQLVWVGWNGLKYRLSNSESKALRLPKEVIGVQLPAKVVKGYYDEYTSGIVWPLLHSLKPGDYPAKSFDDNEIANQLFAAKVNEIADPEDIIWVHDYHLFSQPRYLREAGLDNKIGFFLHIPFPEPRFFKRIPGHKQLLSSVMHADLIGFQTAKDMKNFRKSARELSIKVTAKLEVFPIGIDFVDFHSKAKKQTTRSKNIRKKYGPKKLVFSISRLDYTKGILMQLDAVHELLKQSQKDFVYKLVVAPSREHIKAYAELKEKIASRVDKINRKFPGAVDYTYGSYPQKEVIAWSRAADIMLNVPIIDGMNLLAKEFIASQYRSLGILVLSNTIGAAHQLKDSILVDPKDLESVTNGLRKALNMKSPEAKKRLAHMKDNIRRQTVFWWAEKFIRSLKNVR